MSLSLTLTLRFQELFLIKEERVADIRGQEEVTIEDLNEFSEEIEEVSAAEDLEELQHELQAAADKLKSIRIKMLVRLRTNVFGMIIGFQPCF